MASGYPDYEGSKQKVYLTPEWAAKEATDKNFVSAIASGGFGTGTGVVYTVPAGKTLYITQFSFRCTALNVADGDSNQMCESYIKDNTTGAILWKQGGNGGSGMTFSKPQVIASGHQVGFYVGSFANHDTVYDICGGGYEF
jgi:hypothetical protein